MALREALLLESALTDRRRDELNIAVSEYTSNDQQTWRHYQQLIN